MSRRRRVLMSAGAVVIAGGATVAAVVTSSDRLPSGPVQTVFERGKGVNPAIYVMAVDGTTQRQLLPYGSEPTWSRGGHRIAFVVHSPPEGEAPPDELWVVASDGSDARRAARDDWIRALAWSPDSSKIAWVGTSLRRDHVSVVDVRTGMHRKLATPAGYLGSPNWSPDGREILTIVDDEVVAVDTADGRTRTIRVDARGSEAVRSSDGSRIAYVADPYPPPPEPLPVVSDPDPRPLPGRIVIHLDRSIFVMNAAGNGRRQLTRGAIDSSPSWAPDGGAIVFARAELPLDFSQFDTALYIILVNDAEPRRLTAGPEDDSPDWRPAPGPEPPLGIPRAELPEPSIEVPDVEGLDPHEARRVIEAAGLEPIVWDDRAESPPEVVRQSPSPGTRVPPGTVVAVYYRQTPIVGYP